MTSAGATRAFRFRAAIRAVVAAARRRGRRLPGFTLAEAIATIVVLAVLSAAISPMVLSATDAYAGSATSARLHADLAMAVDRITRELRAIERDDEGPRIDLFKADRIRWHDLGCELRLNQNTLELTIDGRSAPLLTDVVTCSFQAFDDADRLLPGVLASEGCHDIRRISIELQVARQGTEARLRTKIYLRSMAWPVRPGGEPW